MHFSFDHASRVCPGVRTHWLSCGIATLAALVSFSSAAAAPAEANQPAEISLLTTVSTRGAAVIELQGVAADACDALAAKASLTGPSTPAAVSVEPYGACRYVLLPANPLPPGRYCLSLDDSAVDVPQGACMDVTSAEADPNAASVEVEPATRVTPLQLEATSCKPCTQGSERACTRQRIGWPTRVRLNDVAAELASTHVFALVAARGPAPVDTTLPTSPAWSAWGSSLVQPLVVELPDDDEESCVAVYARSNRGGAAGAALGRTCVRDEARGGTQPAPYTEATATCEPTFETRWCDDNHAGCGSGGEAPATCARYAEVCEAGALADAGSAGGSGRDAGSSGGASGGGDSGSGTAGDSGAHADAGAPTAGADSGCGCRIVAARGRLGAGLGPCVASLLWVRRRRRLVRPR